MQELDQTQELIQMLKERLNEKDETIATAKKVKKNKLMNLFVKKPLSRNPVSL